MHTTTRSGVDIESSDQDNLNLANRDMVGLGELLEKDRYLYSLSVVLSEKIRTAPNSYDFRLIHDLLSGKKTQPYTQKDFAVFLEDIKGFTREWGSTKTDYVDEHTELLDVFKRALPTYFAQSHFDHLKSHRLKDRIHRPLLAVLSTRAQEWKATAPNPHDTNGELLANLY